ncbi:dihydroorotate dehydrogenase, electron transfer subunit [Treponema primitia ZAS-2]|uniref:Dihydroorotate dehydrogenase, electron transfer subunit n=1 Tax=Treponema primitia (strain ATCC BAA-887 / DSM 12427 / ZAS-2) TaxID=545694 RepID=F5YIX4_TREPZ|nr:dihydroorotate dehydrogenase electron transfer subunit [Treponema primitia]AEF84205.1 dihydroorotate dehydrogenase, electron transfer subunit [Treponema primitia ZAS-2]
MAQVISNRALPGGFYLLEADISGGAGSSDNFNQKVVVQNDNYLQKVDDQYVNFSHSAPEFRSGQFCMLRAWDTVPVLSRPISVFDAQGPRVSFLYKTLGQGTVLFSRLKPGDALSIQGPLGRGFPELSGRIAMVGGGAGIAPFYLGARQFRAAGCTVDLYLGFSGEPFLAEEYRGLANRVTVNVGGFITDAIDPAEYDFVFTCGPEIMMRVLYDKCKKAGVEDRLSVSLESRMACGVGACFGCSRKTTRGNKKVCKDGPVFPAADVFATGDVPARIGGEI